MRLALLEAEDKDGCAKTPAGDAHGARSKASLLLKLAGQFNCSNWAFSKATKRAEFKARSFDSNCLDPAQSPSDADDGKLKGPVESICKRPVG
jgi:hypothetical protein